MADPEPEPARTRTRTLLPSPLSLPLVTTTMTIALTPPLLLLLKLLALLTTMASSAHAQHPQRGRGQFPPPTFGSSAAAATAPLERPLLMRNLRLSDDIILPVSPATILIVVLSLCFLLRVLLHTSTAAASHILLDVGKSSSSSSSSSSLDEETKSILIRLKADINDDVVKFANAARKYSKCPSGKTAGGCLGTFKRGSMVPPFDKVVFDVDNTKVGKVVGPVRTNYGWHLILVTDRKI